MLIRFLAKSVIRYQLFGEYRWQSQVDAAQVRSAPWWTSLAHIRERFVGGEQICQGRSIVNQPEKHALNFRCYHDIVDIMIPIQTNPPKQVLLRLPEDLAAKLARTVPPRKRNAFLVDLVRRELDMGDQQLIAACEAMNAREAADPEFAREGQEWVDANLTGSVDEWDTDFDAETFSREAAIAQAAMKATAIDQSKK